ncbi:hypothetical protein BB560_005605 [Smittium megazygosporum]|uniref:P-type ATPase A domain-containing protein n=1 Tax=Smittium megazygosporum TaxID=133381 RepID=A0A2T9Z2J7_9FUNG|nr:hypothetical protein BB560_005605 [Smittium megazygosporum]
MAEFEDKVSVIRDGKITEMSTKYLVNGDVYVIEPNKVSSCDSVILTGEVIIDESSLTGEALPTRKTYLKSSNGSAIYDRSTTGRNSSILAGTSVQQVNVHSGEHALALVTGTGTFSQKGKMIQSILYPKETSFIFNVQIKVVMFILAVQGVIWFGLILWLLKRSFVASWFSAMYALVEIISPILPAALVIGQTIAARNLRKEQIYCVDVPKVIVAGKIRIFCFDKTGTLTKQGLEYAGVSQTDSKAKSGVAFYSSENDSSSVAESDTSTVKLLSLTKSQEQYNRLTMMGLASCHSVTKLRDTLIGNPVDIEMFKKSGWEIQKEAGMDATTIVPGDSITNDIEGLKYNPLEIIKEFEFIHHRSRMSVIVQDTVTKELHVFVKGSFERVSSISELHSVPFDFISQSETLAKKGYYVLALAHKNLGKIDPLDVKNWTVEDAELDVSLLGIVCFKNELKPDTADALKEISESDTRVVMITGDTTLTGIHISRESGIISKGKTILFGDIEPFGKVITWTDVDSEKEVSEASSSILLDPKTELAVSGAAFNHLVETGQIQKYLLNIRVFGRMTPQDKVKCVNLHMEKGVTAMCGDGGNDCGALRAANVGMALSGSDASIVSPFSTTRDSIYTCVELMSQGRGALATSFANYKFLILYGQIMAMFKAFSMYYSVTISQPVWITVDGFISIAMSLSISLSKPLKTLANRRPTAKLLGVETISSALGQTILNWLYMVILFVILYRRPWFRCHEFDSSTSDYKKWWLLGDNYEAEILGLVVMMQFANCGFIYNFGYVFRTSWYKNYVLIVVWAAFISIFSYIMLADPNWLGCRFRMNCGDKEVLQSLGYKVPSFSIEPYNNPQGHNIIPKGFRWFLWGYCVSNMIIGMIWEKLVVIGPVGRYLAKMKKRRN